MNQTFNRLNNLVGWSVFAIATVVYLLTCEPTGSLWDCGEFVSAAHKLQVVHPPGAPLFLMIGRLFAFVAETFSSDPATIAYAVNVLSGICTAFTVLFVFWITTILAKLSLVGRQGEIANAGQLWSILGAGIVAGLSATFATSMWFSAVEGEVYAMASFFTAVAAWAGMRWYVSEHPQADRWLIFIAYIIGLSIGVHLLSLLVIPFICLLYFYKHYQTWFSPRAEYLARNASMIGGSLIWLMLVLQAQGSVIFLLPALAGLGYAGFTMFVDKSPKTEYEFPWLGSLVAGSIGFFLLILVQYIIIPKIPEVAANVDYFFVNSLGMGIGMGVAAFFIFLTAAIVGGLWYAQQRRSYNLQMGVLMFAMVVLGFSTYGTILIRANAGVPINMNAPGDPYSLLSYLNREQYGDRPLFYGPHYFAERKQGNGGYKKTKDVYRPVKNAKGTYRYEVVDDKGEIVYQDKDMMFLPRLGHFDRVGQYQRWLGHAEEMYNAKKNPQDMNAYKGWAMQNKRPNMADNLSFLFNYQINWMYIRYFMWNFVGRQNAQQGSFADNLKHGNWISGIGFLDTWRLYSQNELPKSIADDKSRNTYFFLPLIFGLLGMFYHFSKRSMDAFAVMALFLMTGLAIILFLNQPPQEPRERDYAFAGSIFTFCIWIGMAVPLFYESFRKQLGEASSAVVGISLTILAPLVMGWQNWDDHSRANHYGARDYATNFLNSCAPNAIIFTYGDNDTYPLWYAQEVEGIRTDVRVVNFSLLAVDWYINQLRYRINDSKGIKMTISEDAYRGRNRNYLPIIDGQRPPMSLDALVDFLGKSNPPPIQQASMFASFVPTRRVNIPIDKAKIRANNAVPTNVPDSMIANSIDLMLDGDFLMKDEIALLDIIATNAANGWERPIYFAVTCRPEKIMGFSQYLELDGLALRIVPVKTTGDPRMGAMGMGFVEVDTMYNNLMTKFRWGNFDKAELFVDESYMPSVHSLQYSMVRLSEALATRGDKERAVKVLEKFFEAFPHKNFPYDDNRMVLQIIIMAYQFGGESNVKEHVKTAAEALADRQRFFASLSGNDAQQFAQEAQENQFLMQSLIDAVARGTDAETQKFVNDAFAPFQIAPTNVPTKPIDTPKDTTPDTINN